MKWLLSLVLFFTAAMTPCMAAEMQEEIGQGFLRIYMGNEREGLERLEGLVRADPANLEAIWEVAYQGIAVRSQDTLDKRAETLNTGTKAVQAVIKLAHRVGQESLGHYIAARLAETYHAFDRAVAEIDKAIALAPNEARYHRAKGSILMDQATWERDEAILEQALAAFDRGLEVLEHTPSEFTTKGEMNFRIGWNYPKFASDAHSKIIEYYQAALASGDLDRQTTAYAWNNLSISYREVNECRKAKEAAEKALAIFRFGNAQANLSYSNSCLAMEELDFFSESLQAN